MRSTKLFIFFNFKNVLEPTCIYVNQIPFSSKKYLINSFEAYQKLDIIWMNSIFALFFPCPLISCLVSNLVQNNQLYCSCRLRRRKYDSIAMRSVSELYCCN